MSLQYTSKSEHRRQLDALGRYLRDQPDVEFGVLIGSRADGTANHASDWDIALQLRSNETSYMEELARIETLRHEIAAMLETAPNQVDLVIAPSAKLAMRDLIANHGIVLTDSMSLPWLHFLQRTWRELEDYYWEDLYAG